MANKKNDPIFDILRKQEELLKAKPIFYIHYDPVTLSCINMRNYLEPNDTNPNIELSLDDCNFNDPSFSICNYSVDLKSKKLVKNAESTPVIVKMADFIYEIPKIKSKVRLLYSDHPYDLSIEQNNPLGEFRIKLSKPLREKYYKEGKNAQEIYVYVTALNDPNILYKTLKFTFGNLIENEYYTLPFGDFNGYEANVYALKYFEEYIHVDIRDD